MTTTSLGHILKLMMTDKDYKVIAAMEKFGGSFVKALAFAFHRADSTNFKKLKDTFPEYWKEYSKMVEKK